MTTAVFTVHRVANELPADHVVSLYLHHGGPARFDPRGLGQPLAFQALSATDVAGAIAAVDRDYDSVFADRAQRNAHIALGRKLFDLLIRGDIARSWQQLLEKGPRPIRVLLSFNQGNPGAEQCAMSRLPWELMRDAERTTVFTIREMPWSRLQAGGLLVSERGPLRVLIVVCAPGESELRADEELAGIAKALADQLGRVHTEVIDSPTKTKLREAIDTLRPHVLHFIGKGDDDGIEIQPRLRAVRGVRLTPDDIQILLMTWKPWLVVLNACRSAGDFGSGVSGLGDEFLRAGAYSVVSMQSTISPEAACILAEKLYALLGHGDAIDQALAGARRSLTFDGISWAVPRLVTAVHPQNVLKWDFPTDGTSVNNLFGAYQMRDLRMFVGRYYERREAWWALDREFKNPPAGLLVITGDQYKNEAKAGKTWFARWSLMTHHLRGSRVTYVNLREDYKGPDGQFMSAPRDALSLVRAIRAAIIDAPHPDPVPTATFSRFNAVLNAMLAGLERPGTEAGNVNVEDEGRQWSTEIGPVGDRQQNLLCEFFNALMAASSPDRPHVIALDHPENIMEGSGYRDIYRFLLLPIARRVAENLHLIFVLPNGKSLVPDGIAERDRTDTNEYVSVNLPYVDADQFMRLAREYCSRRKDLDFDRDLRGIFESWMKPGRRFPVSHFKEIVGIALLCEGPPPLESMA